MKNYWILLLLLLCLQSFSQEQNLSSFQKAKNQYQDFLKNHSSFIQTQNTKLHYLEWGNPNDPAILWLHGSYSNAFELESFANQIIDLKYRLISIDYYGHGLTEIPKKNFSCSSLLQDINILLDSLQLKNCIIGGFSRGAYLASMFYQQYPQKVKALLLEDGGISPFLEHFVQLPQDSLKLKFEDELKSRPVELFTTYKTKEDAFNALEPFGESKEDKRFINLSFIKKNRDNFSIYKGLDELYGMDDYANISKLVTGTLYDHPFANELMTIDFFSLIKNIKIPALLLEASGPNDPFPKSAYYLKLKANKNIKHFKFDKSGHTIHYEQPEDFSKAIITFLKKLNSNDYTRSTKDSR